MTSSRKMGGGGGVGEGGERASPSNEPATQSALEFCPEETAAQLTISDQLVFRFKQVT